MKEKDYSNKYGCPYRNLTIIVGESKTFYCEIQPYKTMCISQEYDVDCYECSHFLFPPTQEEYEKIKEKDIDLFLNVERKRVERSSNTNNLQKDLE